jgi:excisionase family DNA binding protein
MGRPERLVDVDEDAPTNVFFRSSDTVPVPAPVSRRDVLWDVNDVASYLRVSKSWVYHRVEAGLLPCRRVGGLLRFEPDRIRGLR